MTSPVPGYKITTPYAKRGQHWSCNANSSGGLHTGADFAAPSGTPVVAARPGTVKHTSYGSAFGSKQFAIVCADGTEDFYAHTTSRPTNGKKVVLNERVASVGAEGNVTGPHLHFERHKKAGSWSCSNHTNPQPSIDFDNETGEVPLSGDVYLSKLVYGQQDSDSVKRLQEALNRHPLTGGSNLPVTGNYGDQTDKEVRLCQTQHGFGNDAPKKSSVGPKQADHLFAGTGANIINDLPTTPPVDPEVPPVSGPLFKYYYGGKPSNKQAVGTSYAVVDKGSFIPPGDGFLLSMLYLNCEHAFKSGINEAGFRVRAVRAPFKGGAADYTGYGDFTPNRNLTKPGEFLLTHVWFEMCDGNRKVHWEVDRSSQFSSFTLGTRYAKWVWISVEVFEMLTKTLGMSKAQVAGLMTTFLENPEEAHEFTV